MATVRNTLALTDKFTPVLRTVIKTLNSTMNALSTVDGVSDKAFADIRRDIEMVEKELNDVQEEFGEMGEAARRGASGAKVGLTNLSNGLTSIASGIYTVKNALSTIGTVTNLSDTMSQTQARLVNITGSLEAAEALQKKIFKAAEDSRGSYQSTADLVAKLGINAKDAFSNMDETVAFAEQINKHFVNSGTAASNASAVMLQLTQALGSGVLRGDELNSIFEQAPTIIQAISDYLQVPIGDIREMASEGQITSDILKAAMFSAADETNAKFATMPMTYAQAMTSIQNSLLQTFMPLLEWMATGAQWVADNWESIVPLFVGLAAAVTAYAIGLGAMQVATLIATISTEGFTAALMANPLGLIAVAIGVVIGLIYKWIQSVGGIQIAWETVKSALLYIWDALKLGFTIIVNAILNAIDWLIVGFEGLQYGIENAILYAKSAFILGLETMINKGIEMLNGFIEMLNKIPGVSIEAVGKVTFGTEAALENQAKIQANEAEYQALKDTVDQNKANRRAEELAMAAEANANYASRKADIAELKASKTGAEDTAAEVPDYSSYLANIENDGVKINGDVSITDEDIKLLKDVAALEYINQFTTLRPSVAVSFGDVHETADTNGIIEAVETMVIDALATVLV